MNKARERGEGEMGRERALRMKRGGGGGGSEREWGGG